MRKPITAACLLAALTLAGCGGGPAGPAPAQSSAAAKKHTVVLSLRGYQAGDHADLNYSVLAGESQQVHDAALPWTRTLQSPLEALDDPELTATGVIAGGHNPQLECSISVDGKVVDSHNAEGVVSCKYTVPLEGVSQPAS
ncbi:MmpS family transport accessory protein [Fodinicola acaciae]|uniref:MmpS family transport accessory protein n=1 Tax=Fodinicola acaciae TaxID=2681555 RepID=UPI0013D319F6|nr:MmpS family transport accessory protein [Fodinicola acaciae]